MFYRLKTVLLMPLELDLLVAKTAPCKLGCLLEELKPAGPLQDAASLSADAEERLTTSFSQLKQDSPSRSLPALSLQVNSKPTVKWVPLAIATGSGDHTPTKKPDPWQRV